MNTAIVSPSACMKGCRGVAIVTAALTTFMVIFMTYTIARYVLFLVSDGKYRHLMQETLRVAQGIPNLWVHNPGQPEYKEAFSDLHSQFLLIAQKQNIKLDDSSVSVITASSAFTAPSTEPIKMGFLPPGTCIIIDGVRLCNSTLCPAVGPIDDTCMTRAPINLSYQDRLRNYPTEIVLCYRPGALGIERRCVRTAGYPRLLQSEQVLASFASPPEDLPGKTPEQEEWEDKLEFLIGKAKEEQDPGDPVCRFYWGCGESNSGVMQPMCFTLPMSKGYRLANEKCVLACNERHPCNSDDLDIPDPNQCFYEATVDRFELAKPFFNALNLVSWLDIDFKGNMDSDNCLVEKAKECIAEYSSCFGASECVSASSTTCGVTYSTNDSFICTEYESSKSYCITEPVSVDSLFHAWTTNLAYVVKCDGADQVMCRPAKWSPCNRQLQLCMTGSDVMSVDAVTTLWNQFCEQVDPGAAGYVYCGSLILNTVSPISLVWDGDYSERRDILVDFPIDPRSKGGKFVWKASAKFPLLVYDPSHEGKISAASQLFGEWTFGGKKHTGGVTKWKDGFEALATLDVDHDGVLKDNELRDLALWFDGNTDGVSQDGEVFAAQAKGITVLRFGPSHYESARDLVIVDKGFEAIVDNKFKEGALVDWYSNEVIPVAEVTSPQLDIHAVTPDSPLDYPKLVGIEPQGGNSQQNSMANIPFGMWKWAGDVKINDAIPVGFLTLNRDRDGAIVGTASSLRQVVTSDGKAMTEIRSLNLTGTYEKLSNGTFMIKFVAGESQKPGGQTYTTLIMMPDGELIGRSATRMLNERKGLMKVEYNWKGKRVQS